MQVIFFKTVFSSVCHIKLKSGAMESGKESGVKAKSQISGIIEQP